MDLEVTILRKQLIFTLQISYEAILWGWKGSSPSQILLSTLVIRAPSSLYVCPVFSFCCIHVEIAKMK